MCEYCQVIDNDNPMERGKQEEGIFYNEKENKHYLVIEEFRYERTRLAINFCPMCGEKLDKTNL